MTIQLNVVNTSAADGGGSQGLIETPLLQPTNLLTGPNFGFVDGFVEVGAGTPGSLPFKVDDAGNVTTSGTITAASVNNATAIGSGPSLAGYKAWTYDPTQSLAAGISISTTTFAALVYVPVSFTCTKVDVFQVSGTPNVTVGLWPAAAPAGVAAPLAFSAATAASAAAVQHLHLQRVLIGHLSGSGGRHVVPRDRVRQHDRRGRVPHLDGSAGQRQHAVLVDQHHLPVRHRGHHRRHPVHLVDVRHVYPVR